MNWQRTERSSSSPQQQLCFGWQKETDDAERIATAQTDLHARVDVAQDVGASWQSIGEALGMRRGAAYQRFRRKSHAEC
jgi:hypothetical protein